MTIPLPLLDPQNESTVVAAVVNNLPAEITDRASSSTVVKMIETVGAIYGLMVALLNMWPERLAIAILNLFDIERAAAKFAEVDVEFTKAAGPVVLIPAGTVVKTSMGIDAISFRLTQDLLLQAVDTSGSVEAWAVEAGESGNVAANTLTILESPFPDIITTSNPIQAFFGAEEETIDELYARARSVTRTTGSLLLTEDIKAAALAYGGIDRAVVQGALGIDHITIVGDNTSTDMALIAQMHTDMDPLIANGATLIIRMPFFRKIQIMQVDAVFETGYSTAQVMAGLIPFFDELFAVQTAEFGKDWYDYSLAARVRLVPGIETMTTFSYQISDDGGATYSPSLFLGVASNGFPAHLEATANLDANDDQRLIYADPNQSFNLFQV